MPKDRIKHEINRKVLREYIGLSEYEARIYTSLIGEGSLKAVGISAVSGVPRTKVYTALRRLKEMGVVIEVPQDPKRFIPIPPAQAFENYRKEHERNRKRLFSVISSLEKTFSESKNKREAPESEIALWTIFGRRNILKKMEGMLIKAKDKVEIATNEDGVILLYKEFRRLLDRLNEKSVKIQLSAPSQNLSKYVLEQIRYICKINDVNISLPLVLLDVDKKHFLLANMKSNDASLDSETALFSDNQILAKIIHILLNKDQNFNASHYKARDQIRR